MRRRDIRAQVSPLKAEQTSIIWNALSDRDVRRHRQQIGSVVLRVLTVKLGL